MCEILHAPFCTRKQKTTKFKRSFIYEYSMYYLFFMQYSYFKFVENIIQVFGEANLQGRNTNTNNIDLIYNNYRVWTLSNAATFQLFSKTLLWSAIKPYKAGN